MSRSLAPWSKWLKREAVRFYWSFKCQWNRWRMFKYPIGSDEFKERFRRSIILNGRVHD